MTREEVLVAAKKNWQFLRKNPEWNNDKEIVMASVKQFKWALEFASDELKNDKEIILAAIVNYSNACKWSLLEGYQDFNEIVEKEGEDFLFSCWDNKDVQIRMQVANHPDFIPTLEQIENKLNDNEDYSFIKEIYQLRQDEWISKIEENKLRNTL